MSVLCPSVGTFQPSRQVRRNLRSWPRRGERCNQVLSRSGIPAGVADSPERHEAEVVCPSEGRYTDRASLFRLHGHLCYPLKAERATLLARHTISMKAHLSSSGFAFIVPAGRP
jgi:hypothetical protein